MRSLTSTTERRPRAPSSRAVSRAFSKVLRDLVSISNAALGHAASQRRAAHDLGFGDRPGAAARQHQQRRGPLSEQLDPALEAPLQRRRGAAPEDDDGIGVCVRCRRTRLERAKARGSSGCRPFRRRPSGRQGS